GTVLAHKTGAVDRTRTDAGILYTARGPVALCVLTTENEDTTWRRDNAGNLLCARVARSVFDDFGADDCGGRLIGVEGVEQGEGVERLKQLKERRSWPTRNAP